MRPSATLDTAATTVTGRAPASDPIVVDGDLVFAEPPRGWSGAIRPVALLESIGGGGSAGSVAGDVALSSGCRPPVGTPDSGCGLGEWLFDPPNGEWSGAIAAPLAATDGEGNAGSSPPAPVLVDDATVASPREDGAIDVDHISAVNAYRYRAPVPRVTASPLRGPGAGPTFSLRIETRRPAPTGGTMTVRFPRGLRLTPYATTHLNRPSAVVHHGRLTLGFGPGRLTRIDFGDGTLHESTGFRSGRLQLTLDYAGRTVRRTVTVGRASR